MSVTKTVIRLIVTTLGCLLLFLAGCASQPAVEEDDKPKGDFVWPIPPDEPRYRYVMTIRSSRDIGITEEQTMMEELTGVKKEGARFAEPFDIAASKGLILVTDTRKRVIHAFDIPRRRYFLFGYRFEGKTEKPLGVSISSKGYVYVVDGKRKAVIVYDRLGLYQRLIGEEGQFDRPSAVAVSADGERIAVVDTGGIDSSRHRVDIFDVEGNLLQSIGKRGGGEGEFNLPNGVAYGPDGSLYVLDAGNFRVQAFDGEGNYLRQWGEVGRRFGQFSRPKGITTDRYGNVYVSDASFGNVQIFNAEGELLLPVGRQSQEDYPGYYAMPVGVALDEAGFFYIVDRFNKKVDVLKQLPIE